jgi:hypothetical protein
MYKQRAPVFSRASFRWSPNIAKFLRAPVFLRASFRWLALFSLQVKILNPKSRVWNISLISRPHHKLQWGEGGRWYDSGGRGEYPNLKKKLNTIYLLKLQFIEVDFLHKTLWWLHGSYQQTAFNLLTSISGDAIGYRLKCLTVNDCHHVYVRGCTIFKLHGCTRKHVLLTHVFCSYKYIINQ